MAFPPLRDEPGLRLSSLPSCWPIWSGGALLPRMSRPHHSLRVALVQPLERGGKRVTLRYRQRRPAMTAGRTHRRWTAGEVLSCRRFSLMRHRSQRWLLHLVTARWVKVPAEALGWRSTLGREGISGLPYNEKPARTGFGEAGRFIHFIQWEYPGFNVFPALLGLQ